jgi:hypothetical protein
MIGFIGTSVTSSLNHTYLESYRYSTHFQFTAAHVLEFSSSNIHFLATDLNTETITSNHYEVFLSLLLQSPWNAVQFLDSTTPVSVLHGTNLYILIFSIYFHWSSQSVSWQQIYNTFTVNKSSNHKLSLHKSTSTTNFLWLFITANCLTIIL